MEENEKREISITLNLTPDELAALDNYAFKKMCYLEENHLKDATCYQLFCKIHYGIMAIKK